MNDNPIIIVVDADAIVAQASPTDSLHNKTVQLVHKLAQLDARILYPATAIVEAITHIQRVLSSGATAYGAAVNFTDSDINVVEINQETIKNALHYFGPTTSKKNTLFDCVVAAVAKEHHADAIFSFDKFYQKNGFKLASDL